MALYGYVNVLWVFLILILIFTFMAFALTFISSTRTPQLGILPNIPVLHLGHMSSLPDTGNSV